VADVTIEVRAMLLERERELAVFASALREAERGRGGVVLVEAPAGLGKTSLLNVAGEAASEAGFACFRARASELERDFAYGCVRQLLEPAVVNGSSSGLFEGAASLSKPLFVPASARDLAPSADRAFSMLHGLYWLLNNLTDERPAVLSLDDLHWCDAESLRFLAYLAPRLDGLALAVLASTRGGEPVAEGLARLAAAPETTLLRPRPLSVQATSRLCELRLGVPVADEFAEACRRATAGNPFLLEALLREVDEQEFPTDTLGTARVERTGPAAVAQAVLLRLSGAPAAATALVRAAAVLGDGAGLGEAARLADVDHGEATRAADLLAALAILKPGGSLEFVHPIVREAVSADIGSHERAGAHARAALVLAAAGASEERIAAQIIEAEPAGDADRVELLRRVGADALSRGAPAAAVAWLGRALAEPPAEAKVAEVLFELGSAELRIGAPDAIAHLTAAVELTREPTLHGTSARLLGLALTFSDDSDRAVEAIESAIGVVEPHDRELALLLEGELAAHAQEANLERRAWAAQRLQRYSDLEGVTPGERLVLASIAFERARASESEREAVAELERALAGGRLLDEQAVDVTGPSCLLLVGLLATDALHLADACLEQKIADARAQASIPAVAFMLGFRGRVSLRRGAVVDAEEDARTALELLVSGGIQLGRAFVLAVLIEALIEEGEVEAAEQALRSSGFADDIPPGLPVNDLLEARGLLRVAQGRPSEGLDDLIEFGRRDALWGGANRLASRWRSHASLALAAMGDGERAQEMALDDLEQARRWGAASRIGVALRAAGLAAGAAASVDRLSEAVRVLERSPARLEQARALTDLGAARRRANQRSEARNVLRAGLALANRCGARALAERAGIELRSAGDRSSSPDEAGMQQLTVSERRVAELAAAGHSNPEIAQSLFVTRKTIETHLGHVYRKLGISGRGELGPLLADQPPAAER
jgi:DNA-binding CsgD family transcriptional regulator